MKIQALREALRDRVANITDDYENRIADLRIELTEVSMARDSAMAELTQLRQEKSVQEEARAAEGSTADSDNAN